MPVSCCGGKLPNVAPMDGNEAVEVVKCEGL